MKVVDWPRLLGGALALALATPLAAQTRIIVPIIVSRPGAAAVRAVPTGQAVTRGPSVAVTTRSVSPSPGVTETEVTVHETTGAVRATNVPPSVVTGATQPVGARSVLIRVDRQPTPASAGDAGPTTTRVTVRDGTGALRAVGPAPVQSQAAASGATSTVTITGDTGAGDAGLETPIVILGE
ncbi:MAG TPA: hypothetical protein VFC42_04035 [Methylomirabilota bacterium]|nr:hypothetical protein [Methylomirabilota bacterium]